MREFHDRLTLISYGEPSVDEWGNQVRPEVPTVVLCSANSVMRNEFYQASTAGHHPAYTVYIHPFEYGGQRLCELNRQRFSITRTFLTEIEGVEYLELQLAERIGNG